MDNQRDNRGYWQPQPTDTAANTYQAQAPAPANLPTPSVPPSPQPVSALPEQPVAPAPQPVAPAPVAAQPTPEPVSEQTPQPQPQSQPQPSTYSGYELFQQAEEPNERSFEDDFITWQASEYVHHEKNFAWFFVFGILALVAIGISIWLQAWTFLVLSVVMAIALGIFAMRPPHTLHYTLSGQGIKIDDHTHGFDEFRAFGLLNEETGYSVLLIPVKRLMPATTVYFNEADGEKIIDILGSKLPMEEIHQDPIDKLMHRLRF